jgi:hypothetical protein
VAVGIVVVDAWIAVPVAALAGFGAVSAERILFLVIAELFGGAGCLTVRDPS